jgi:hypothetical protein
MIVTPREWAVVIGRTRKTALVAQTMIAMATEVDMSRAIMVAATEVSHQVALELLAMEGPITASETMADGIIRTETTEEVRATNAHGGIVRRMKYPHGLATKMPREEEKETETSEDNTAAKDPAIIPVQMNVSRKISTTG